MYQKGGVCGPNKFIFFYYYRKKKDDAIISLCSLFMLGKKNLVHQKGGIVILLTKFLSFSVITSRVTKVFSIIYIKFSL